MKNKKLPEYWCVQNDGSQLFKDTVVKYMCEQGEHLKGTVVDDWYGYFASCKSYNLYTGENARKGTTELTLGEFVQFTEKFTLPERWCIKVTEESINDVADFYAKQAWGGYAQTIRKNDLGKYYYSHNLANDHSILINHQSSNFDLPYVDKKYTEITYAQFKQYVIGNILKSYTVNEVVNIPKVVIFLESEEQFLKIKGTREFTMVDKFYGPYCYSLSDRTYSISSTRTTAGAYGTNVKIIQFHQIKFEMKDTKKIVAYRLIETYPGSEELGYVTSYDSVICAKYPKFWKPIYTEDYKVGSIVVLIGTGSSVSRELTPTGKTHYGAKVGDCRRIDGITPTEGSASTADPRYYGKDFNLRAKDLRLATAEEIEAFNTKILYFGELKITIKNGADFGKCEYGTITKSEIKQILDLFNTKIKILTYNLSIKDATLHFGCQNGTIEQAQAIFDAMS